MHPTQMMLGGGGSAPIGKYNKYLGGWGNFGGLKQRGIITYGISPNRQNPLAGTAHDAVFNTFRRVSSQFLYWAPSLVAGYYITNWAIERNHYLNSKEGRAEFAGQESE